MTQADRESAIAEHVEWCRQQKVRSQEQIDFFTTHNGKIKVAHAGGDFKDVTKETLDDHRRIIDDMDRIIAAYGSDA